MAGVVTVRPEVHIPDKEGNIESIDTAIFRERISSYVKKINHQ